MTIWHWIVIADLSLSALFVFGRGCAGTARRYTMLDAICGLIEVGFLIWVVAVKL